MKKENFKFKFKRGDLVAVYRYFDPNNLHNNYKKRMLGIVMNAEGLHRDHREFRFYKVAFIGSDELEPRVISEEQLVAP